MGLLGAYVTILLKDPRTNINIHNKDGSTALHIAYKNGCKDIVQQLLANPNIDTSMPLLDRIGLSLWLLYNNKNHEKEP